MQRQNDRRTVLLTRQAEIAAAVQVEGAQLGAQAAAAQRHLAQQQDHATRLTMEAARVQGHGAQLGAAVAV